MSARLMRVNHVGGFARRHSIRGQALTSREPSVRESLRGAAGEETEHLAWTEQRLADLGRAQSLLNPLWYAGGPVSRSACGASWRQVEPRLSRRNRASGRGAP